MVYTFILCVICAHLWVYTLLVYTPSWPRSWANFSLLQLYSHRNARANFHRLRQPDPGLGSGPSRHTRSSRPRPTAPATSCSSRWMCRRPALACRRPPPSPPTSNLRVTPLLDFESLPHRHRRRAAARRPRHGPRTLRRGRPSSRFRPRTLLGAPDTIIHDWISLRKINLGPANIPGGRNREHRWSTADRTTRSSRRRRTASRGGSY